MLVSSTTSSSTPQPPRVRIRTLNVCEPSHPSRDIIRQENYARRKAQELQGWGCPRTVPYQGIDPVHLPPKPPKTITVKTFSAFPPYHQILNIFCIE